MMLLKEEKARAEEEQKNKLEEMKRKEEEKIIELKKKDEENQKELKRKEEENQLRQQEILAAIEKEKLR